MSIDEALASYCKRCGHMQSCERMCPALEYELNETAYEPVRLENNANEPMFNVQKEATLF